MDLNKIRKLAGMSMLAEAKKKAESVVDPTDDSEPAEVPAKGKDKKKEDDELPAIVAKIALAVCKKFGIGDPKGEPSDDLTAMEDFLNKVYQAGIADGKKETAE